VARLAQPLARQLASPLGRTVPHPAIEGVGVTRALQVYGDSTATMNGASEYGRGWSWQFINDVSPVWDFNNSGVGGETSAQMLAHVEADAEHRNWPTVFMDRPNTGETSAEWIANMKAAAALLRTSRWLVFPPAQNAPDTAVTNIAEVQALLLSDPFFAGHTLDATDQAAYLAAVDDANTRSDGVHFNDQGQFIQSLFVRAFFAQQGWRELAAETVALAARMTSTPTTRRKAFMNALIEREKKAGVWAKRDAFYVLAAHDSQAAALNWIADQYNLSVVRGGGALTFAADEFYKGTGFSDTYLASGFNPTTAVSPQFTLNSAHMGIWSRTNLQNGANPAYEIGNALSQVQRGTTSGLGRTRPNYFSTRDIGSAAFPGQAMWSRTAASVWEGYSNGVDTGGGTDTASGLTNAQFTLCALPDLSAAGVNELCTGYWGSGLTATQAFEDFVAQNAYLKVIGAV